MNVQPKPDRDRRISIFYPEKIGHSDRVRRWWILPRHISLSLIYVMIFQVSLVLLRWVDARVSFFNCVFLRVQERNILVVLLTLTKMHHIYATMLILGRCGVET